MTGNTAQRLALFGIGIPMFVVVALYAPFWNNAVLVLVVMAIQVAGTVELAGILGAAGTGVKPGLPAAASVATSLAVYLACIPGPVGALFPGPLGTMALAAGLGILAMAAPAAFAKTASIPSILARVGALVLTYAYTGILGAFLVMVLAAFGQRSAAVLSFVIITFANDSLAWLFGVTLGKRRGIVPVSPNKSVAGFIGGMAGSIGAALAVSVLYPDAGFGGVAHAGLLGGMVGAAAIVGDLVESGFKRSAGVKDSGRIVPGRGGVLDSFDSLLFAAPVFVAIAGFTGLFSPVFR